MKIKIVATTAFFVLINLGILFSQGIHVGIKGGINIANQSFTTSGVSRDTDSKIGLMLGGYLTIMISNKFDIQPELVYSQMGYSLASLNPKLVNSYDYLSLPIILKYSVYKNFSLQAGPQLGILLAASSTNGINTIDIKDSTTGLDFGGTFGIGLDFGKFNGGARYYLGFSNLYKNPPAPDFKQANYAYQLFISYTILGK